MSRKTANTTAMHVVPPAVPVNWFHWEVGPFMHYLNLSAVVQWLYCAGPGEHTHVWLASQEDCLRFTGEDARYIDMALRQYTGIL